jgi:hypothetical protein
MNRLGRLLRGGFLILLCGIAAWIFIRMAYTLVQPAQAFTRIGVVERAQASSSPLVVAAPKPPAAKTKAPVKKKIVVEAKPAPVFVPEVVATATVAVVAPPVEVPSLPPLRTEIVVPTFLRVLINEVSAGTENSGDDEFIELYNPGDGLVPLTGWSIKKKTAGGSESSLVSAARLEGKVIPPLGFFLIAHDEGYRGSGTVHATWAKSNNLAAKNNAIALYDASSTLIDQVSWTEIPKGASWARTPSMKGEHFDIARLPTPGS